MLNLLKALRQDEYGVILSTEIVIIGSILVIGLITGLTCLQKSVNEELKDVANAIGSLDQSYSFSGHQKPGLVGRCCAWTAGSSYLNCENGVTAQRTDIVGCCNQSVSTSSCGNCGTCNACQSAVSVPAGTACGTCGKASCGGCSGVGHHHSSHSFDVQTGVNKVRVTETHLSPVAPATQPCNDCPPSAVPAVPVIEDAHHLNPQPIPPVDHHHEVKPEPQTQPLPPAPAPPVPPETPMPPQA